MHFSSSYKSRFSPVGLSAALALVLVASIPLASPALAANVAPRLGGSALGEAEASRKALFAKMLADPSDVKLALAYARLSADVGDLEGAISTLERLLVLAPADPVLNVELGGLYLRLGAYAQAATYFTTAANAPGASADLKAQATALAARTSQQATGDSLTGSISAGLRYQTNANSGVTNPTVDLFGLPFKVSPSAMADDDANGFVALALKGSKDLQSQGDRWDGQLSVYASAYRDHSELNSISADVQTGPVFNLARIGLHDASLGVYGIASAMTLEGVPYLYTLGAGTQLVIKPGPQTTITTALEYRLEAFQNSASRPSVSDMSGGRTRLTSGLTQEISPALALYASFYGERNEAQVARQADWEAGGTAGARLSIGGGNGARPWLVDVSAGVVGRLFDAADPVYSTDRREDVAAVLRGVVTAPLAGGWSATGTASYMKQISNYDLFAFDNISASLALSKGF